MPPEAPWALLSVMACRPVAAVRRVAAVSVRGTMGLAGQNQSPELSLRDQLLSPPRACCTKCIALSFPGSRVSTSTPMSRASEVPLTASSGQE